MQANTRIKLILPYIMSTTNLTTTNIGVDELKHLKKLALKHKLRQVEFINASISYFRKTGINPSEEIYSPREEIERLTKRVDEVIRFMQVHERQKLSPLTERLILLDKRINESISNLNGENPTQPVIDLSLAKKDLGEIKEDLFIKIERNRDYIKEDLTQLYLLQKKTLKIIELLFLCFKHSRTGYGFQDNELKNLENALSEIR